VKTVTIYQFEVYRIDSDEVVKLRRRGTREAIIKIDHGRVLDESTIEVDEWVVASDIHGFTVRHFDPQPRSGFQTSLDDNAR
jgi:hypothetical protein